MTNNKLKIDIFKLIFEKINKIKINRPILLAIDGVDGSGKSYFAKELVVFLKTKKLKVIHSSIDHFHNPRAKRRSLKKQSYQSFFEDSFNYNVLKKILLEPLRHGTRDHCVLEYFDHKTDSKVNSKPIKYLNESILIFDGIFNHRDELIDFWDLSIFLSVDFNESYRRMALRDKSPIDPKDKLNERYYKGQKIYLNKCNPLTRASLVVDNNDYSSPKLMDKRQLDRLNINKLK